LIDLKTDNILYANYEHYKIDFLNNRLIFLLKFVCVFLLNLAPIGKVSLGWPWVEVIAACPITGTGRKRTLDMSIVE